MSNPKNNSHGFFNDPNSHPFSQKFKPMKEEIFAALMHLVAQHPDFYKKPDLRMLVAGGMCQVLEELNGAMDRGERPDLHPGYAAFMMLMADRMSSSYEQYASDEERKMFPHDPSQNPRCVDEDEEEDWDSED